MKDSTKRNLVIFLPASICAAAGLIVVPLLADNLAVNDAIYLYDGFEIYVNQNCYDNLTVQLFDSNGSIVFEGNMNNESMWNTSLTLTISFRDIAYLMAPFDYGYDRDGIIEQIADQMDNLEDK